jgi:tetratricopeptide (TPR) repeat protein
MRKETTMNLADEMMKQLKAVVDGKATWAELEGITFEEAQKMAKTGCELADAGRLDEARQVFEGMTAINPKDAAAHAALGTVYQKLDRLEDAVIQYDAAIALDPKNPVALGNRGELRLKRGDLDGMDDLVKAVEAEPEGTLPASKRATGLLTAIALGSSMRHRNQAAAAERKV